MVCFFLSFRNKRKLCQSSRFINNLKQWLKCYYLLDRVWNLIKYIYTKNKFYISYLLILIIGFECSSKSDREIQFKNNTFDVFNKEERVDLEVLIRSFENCLGESTNKEKLYSDFFVEINTITTVGKLLFVIDSIFGEEKIDELISEDTFSKIWIEEVRPGSKSASKTSLSIDINSPYAKYLKKLAEKKGGIVSDYYDSFIIGGCINPSMVAMVQKQYDLLDINDDEVCLLLAVHYLTLSTTIVRMR